jgi:hypothetical protein
MTKSVVVAQLPGNTRSVYNNLLEVEKDLLLSSGLACSRPDDHAAFLPTRSGRERGIETARKTLKPTNCK